MGDKDEFYLDISDSLHAPNLGQELDKFIEETRMLIVIDACNSGSFITDPNNISAKNRIIVASAHDDKKIYPFLSAHFSFDFWLHLLQGEDVRQSFIEGTKDANHKIAPLVPLLSCQPWLDDNGDANGHSPEFLEQHSPESEGDEGWLAANMIIGVPGAPPSVGESASDPSLFEDCYDRNGGATKLGYPINKVHRWGDGYIQDFQGGDGYEGAIMQPDDVNYAYAVYGAIGSKYLVLGGAEGSLEYPLNDESDLPSSSTSGAECRYNKFYGGAIVHHATGPDAGLTVFLGHGIFNKWEELNYGESALGLPTSDEGEASQSLFVTLRGGHICWHRTGEYNDKAFETHGAIDSTYHGEGGSGSWLGFPINEEYKDSETSYARSDFEGGYITTPDGINYYAAPYDLSTSTITVGHTPDADYWNIQDAINASNNGDSIIVWYGAYNEHIVVNKSLTIKSRDGAGSTFINGMGTGTVIHSMADDVTIDGFTVADGEIGIKISSDNTNWEVTDMFIEGMENGTGIYVSADSVSISGFSIRNCGTGIKLSSNDCSVSNNNIMNIKNESSAHGIYLCGYNNVIFNNTILSVCGGDSQGGYGIYLSSATNAIISNNTITSVSGGDGYPGSDCDDLWGSAGDGGDGGKAMGIYVTSSTNSPTIFSNTISNIFGGSGGRGGNGVYFWTYGGDGGDVFGTYMESGAHSTIDNNMIAGACGGSGGSGGYGHSYGGGDGGDGGDAFGMYLESVAYSTIDNNMISGACGGSGESGGDSYYGGSPGVDGIVGTGRNVYLTSSSSNTITHNTLSTSDYGFYVTTGSVMNLIYNNNITDSGTKEGYDSGGSNGWDSGPITGGNYWSDYTGEDENGDGIGDTPYELAGGMGAKDYYPFMNESSIKNDTTPPLITHTPVTSATESEPIPISATITDSGGIASTTLFYRITGTTWTSLSMAADVNIYTASIPASSVTTAGVEYYIRAMDSDSNTAYSPATAPATPYSITVTSTPGDGSSVITISAEPSTINLSESVTISGDIIPAHSAIVTLTFTSPAGTNIEQPVLSTISGAYHIVFPANEDGTWLVNATWAGDADHTGSTSETIPFNVISTEIDVGYAIIIAGRNDEGLSQPYIDLTANRTYKTLLKRGFTAERICYLNPSAEQDANGDGVSDVDMISSLTNVSYAINTWTQGNVSVDAPLLIYMVDHGGNDTFLVNGAANILTASDLNSYLDQLTADTGCHDIVVVYEACSSGSFVDDLSATGRIIVTSTNIDADAGIDNTGAFFSKYFFKGISDGKTIKEAFEDASNAPEIIAYSQLLVSFGLPPQTPLLDDNGDATGHAIPLAGTGDGLLAASGYIGTQWGALDFPPTITGVIQNQKVAVGTSIDIWAVVVDDSTIDDVYATIIEPSYSISDANDTLFEMNTTTLHLEDSDADGNYTASFTLAESGNYTVIVHATDSEGNIASPKQCTITSTALGDANGDSKLTSADATLALQLSVKGQYSDAADVNRDGKVTSLDALMILQACAGKIVLSG